MLTIISTILGIITTSIITPNNRTWNTITAQSSILLLTGNILLINNNNQSNNLISNNLNTDWLSSPLIILSLWLVPVSLLASIGHLNNKPNTNSREFTILILIILLALTITFSTNNLIIFFLGFESTLIPTLLLITRWGMQQERIEAGYYFVTYTLISSLPLFISILSLYNINNHNCIPLNMLEDNNASENILPIFCLIAFLVKVPIFTLHLWLPKAHVEAPVAGSMILAAILLKMGGYGFIRLTSIFWLTFNNTLSPILIPFCCWGGLLTSIICLSQTDLKSLIAYSSVSHMSFMIAGLSLLTNWATIGGIIMMIAHGIVSSALFATANILYERSKTRTLNINRGLKSSLSMTPNIWLILACANLGLPPTPNAIGETLLFSTIINQNIINIIIIAPSITLTAIFSLTLYQLINSGNNFKWNNTPWNINERELLMITIHILPLILLITNPNLIST
uniref:NADH-ubiquinone oxidoreductase chain 4 n=1 Tax=Ophiarachnella gorgonia TaxID=1365872 RepID=A0A6C0FFQ0_9ECHI|nr:NADH dehydrogenase subunit 4 [Ophiarachnella gorgonia]QHT54254.1 NADH dehydrogenase subunit 4 [Ophiarachnella gorgonia]